MDQMGDQITQTFNDLDINDKTISELMDDMKDKCEEMVVKSDDNLLRRNNASEAEVDTDVDNSDHKTIDEVIKVSVVETDENDSEPKSPKERPKTEKWGESVGIFDVNGSAKRVVGLNEMKNYLVLNSFQLKSDFNIYCSLINERFPRFFDSTVDYLQRWRMRYNIFATNVLEDTTDPSVVHIGELHLYFDLIPKYPNPHYMNSSFYTNSNPTEKPLNAESVEDLKRILDSIRRSKDVFQLRFPLKGDLFRNTDHIFDKFMERQQEMIEESRAVHRRGYNRKRFFTQNDSRGRPSHSFRGAMNGNDRDFGQTSRDFHQTGREFSRNDNNFGQRNRGFGGNDRNSSQMYERQGFYNTGRMSGRGFEYPKQSDRKPRSVNGENRRNKGNENNSDSEVTFEDTRERHERDKSFPNSINRAFNRFDRPETKLTSNAGNYRSNAQSFEPQYQRRNSDPFRGKDKQFSSSFGKSQASGAHSAWGSSKSVMDQSFHQFSN